MLDLLLLSFIICMFVYFFIVFWVNCVSLTVYMCVGVITTQVGMKHFVDEAPLVTWGWINLSDIS